ncbi:tryptophan halogenase family protein [Alteromonas oceanisediminis]|uniref:tryptophan halogenase family protein n=1 Tax=Alteromonas oceanisediminis TaxID=2836180 RepID=UPI001BDA95C6|nr:tryptophan halogenase family protein [Alteromonas oceanisediminis]MBT0584980.1 tryptophan 7-halogenase [Alteromonas oceanisediminis]
MFQAPKHPIQSVVILGGGTAGWMTAAALVKLLPQSQLTITLVESDAIGTVGVGEATLPHLRYFNQRLGIDERQFIRETGATFKLGIEFSHWGRQGDAYIHPFGDYGKPANGVNFHHFYTAAKRSDPSLSLDSFSLPVMACKAKRFDFPSTDPQSLLSTYSYAYHIDAGQYARFLRSFSEALGVTRIEGKVVDVITRVSNGEVAALTLENGDRIDGDFFVDCSGFRGQLIEQTLHAGYEDWSHWLPCNRAVAVPSKHAGDPLPYTKAIAREAGWQWQIPLQHRMGNGLVYCDEYMTAQQAEDSLLNALPGAALAQPNHLRFCTGKRQQSWLKNCVAIGLSSGFVEPLESTSIYLIQAAVMKLIELMPQRANMVVKGREYNRYFDHEMTRIRDFLILHYHATQRDDSAFWRYCKTMLIPDSLQEKMTLFTRYGMIEPYRYGLFLEPSWVAVYYGQGIIPQSVDARAVAQHQHDTGAATAAMAELAKQVDESVMQLPTHAAWLNRLHSEHTPVPAGQTASASLYGVRHG